ncbi:hypothetical protein F5X68DRAFT_201938 [Plectosphaerella plurivora]|uniref:Zn(2)-C6 fungal-type domain-containing protein n=1 Tax=Plectosphaerella plurivora TaxID=936078 RepID=A0A9P8VGS2_9PEZI|nr:hypothetical protein F5X68DRAFT_201938 [Plectosphaerella plurivora]
MDVESEDYSEVERESLRDQDDSPAHDETGSATGKAGQPVQKLACDICRNRKVRCDRRDPCSRCLRMKTSCSYTAVKPLRKKRPRILVSNQYENKIDEISRKIDTICKLFDGEQAVSTPQGSSVKHLSANHTPVMTPPTAPAQSVAAEPSRLEETQAREPEYEGGSALSAHTAFATKFLQTAVDRDSTSTPIPPETASALHDLQHLTAVGQLDRAESLCEQLPNAIQPGASPAVLQVEMPLAQLVFAGIRIARENDWVRAVWAYEFESVEHFQDYFLSVYGSNEPTLAERIVFFAGLLPLFSECASVVKDQPTKDQYLAQAAICQRSLETLLASLPFHLPSTYDYALALALAANYSADKCRPALAWNFNCTAARMSQAMGFHKAALQDTAPSEAERRKARVFAVIYSTDKMLSLRLGRGSAIRSKEMPVDHSAMLKWVNTAPNRFPKTWIRFAQLQGLVYDRLYSPEAIRQPVMERATRARRLAQDLEKDATDYCEHQEAFSQRMQQAIGGRYWDIMCHSDRVARLALMCLIQRNIPPTAGSGTAFSEECISTAREALLEHQICMTALASEPGSIMEIYLTWALLMSPFVPFIVLLCHVAETCDPSDLELLGGMIASIEGMGDAMPRMTKQLRLFKPLYEVASKFVEAKTAAAPLTGTFDTFFQDVNMDVPFDVGLLSTFGQALPQDEGDAGTGQVGDASIIDVWTYLDSPYP